MRARRVGSRVLARMLFGGASSSVGLSALAACGAATGLAVERPPASDDAGSGGPADARHDSRLDASVDVALDAGEDAAADAGGDAPRETGTDAGAEAGQCAEGLNTMYPPTECSGPTTYWLASPYQPAGDITVERIEIHTTGGSVALLASDAGGPGTLLFSGSVGASATPSWLATNVTPPVSLNGGELYYLAFEGSYCSMASGAPQQTEYGSASLEGPRTVTGTDTWTARVLGTCP